MKLTNYKVAEGIIDSLSENNIHYIFLRKFRKDEINSSNGLDILVDLGQLKYSKKIILNYFRKEKFKIALINSHSNLSYDIYAYKIYN